MLIWIAETGEPLPAIDGNFRELRCGILSRLLAVAGHHVLWWASNFDHWLKKDRFKGPRTFSPKPNLAIRLLPGLKYKRNASPLRWLHNNVLALAFEREASASRKMPDIIFCCLPTLEMADRVVKFGKKKDIPVIVDIRDLWPDHYLTMVPDQFRGLFKMALNSEFRKARNLLSGATGITAISKTFLRWGLEMAGRPPRAADGYFPMGYPEMPSDKVSAVGVRQRELVSEYQLSDSDFVVAFVGTFCSSYALDCVMDAARILQNSGETDFRFMLIGDGANGDKLRSMSNGLKNVTFTGWFDQVSISAALGLCSVGIAPYSQDASMSLPNKLFEYMAAGLPLLSSLKGELEQMIQIEQIGLQYESNSPKSLVEKLMWIKRNGPARDTMAARALDLYRNEFCEEVAYSKLISHLEMIANPTKA